MCRATQLSTSSGMAGPAKVPQPAWVTEGPPVTTRRGALPEPQVFPS